jgi:hypothetical protein
MPQKEDEQSERTPARGEPSSETVDLREDTAAEFHEIALDAYSFKQKFPAESPASKPLTIARAVKSVKLMDARAVAVNNETTEWRNRSRKLIKRFVASLCVIRRNYSWVKSQVKAAQPQFEPDRRTWIGIASELTGRVMVDCDPAMRIEAMKKVRLDNENALARTQRLALTRARLRIMAANKSKPSGDVAIPGVPVPAWDDLKHLGSISQKDAAKYLRCTARTIYTFIKDKRLNKSKSGRVACDEKLYIELRKKHGEQYRR